MRIIEVSSQKSKQKILSTFVQQQELITKPDHKIIYLSEGRTILGFLIYYYYKQCIQILHIETKSPFRQIGIASLLVEYLCYKFANSLMAIEFNERNLPLEKLLNKFGFVYSETQDNVYYRKKNPI